MQNSAKKASKAFQKGLTEGTKKDVSISQSKKSGLTVAEGTNITVTLSSGIIEKVNVPSFVGKSKSEIESSCNSLGIKCNFSYNNNYFNDCYQGIPIIPGKNNI